MQSLSSQHQKASLKAPRVYSPYDSHPNEHHRPFSRYMPPNMNTMSGNSTSLTHLQTSHSHNSTTLRPTSQPFLSQNPHEYRSEEEKEDDSLKRHSHSLPYSTVHLNSRSSNVHPIDYFPSARYQEQDDYENQRTNTHEYNRGTDKNYDLGSFQPRVPLYVTQDRFHLSPSTHSLDGVQRDSRSPARDVSTDHRHHSSDSKRPDDEPVPVASRLAQYDVLRSTHSFAPNSVLDSKIDALFHSAGASFPLAKRNHREDFNDVYPTGQDKYDDEDHSANKRWTHTYDHDTVFIDSEALNQHSAFDEHNPAITSSPFTSVPLSASSNMTPTVATTVAATMMEEKPITASSSVPGSLLQTLKIASKARARAQELRALSISPKNVTAITATGNAIRTAAAPEPKTTSPTPEPILTFPLAAECTPLVLSREVDRLRAAHTLLQTRLARIQASAMNEKMLREQTEARFEETFSLLSSLRERLAAKESELGLTTLERDQNHRFKRLYESALAERDALAESLEGLGSALVEDDLKAQLRSKSDAASRKAERRELQQAILQAQKQSEDLRNALTEVEKERDGARKQALAAREYALVASTAQRELREAQAEKDYLFSLLRSARSAMKSVMELSLPHGNTTREDDTPDENEASDVSDVSVLSSFVRDVTDLRVALKLVKNTPRHTSEVDTTRSSGLFMPRDDVFRMSLISGTSEAGSASSSTLSLLRERLRFALEETRDERKLRVIQESATAALQRELAETRTQRDSLALELQELRSHGVILDSQTPTEITTTTTPTNAVGEDQGFDPDLFDLALDDSVVLLSPEPVVLPLEEYQGGDMSSLTSVSLATSLRSPDSLHTLHPSHSFHPFRPFRATVLVFRVESAVLNSNFPPFASPDVVSIVSFRFWDFSPVSSRPVLGLAPTYFTGGQYKVDVDTELEQYLLTGSVSLLLFTAGAGAESEPVAVGSIPLRTLFSHRESYLKSLSRATDMNRRASAVRGNSFKRRITLHSPVTKQVVATLNYSLGTLHPIFSPHTGGEGSNAIFNTTPVSALISASSLDSTKTISTSVDTLQTSASILKTDKQDGENRQDNTTTNQRAIGTFNASNAPIQTHHTQYNASRASISPPKSPYHEILRDIVLRWSTSCFSQRPDHSLSNSSPNLAFGFTFRLDFIVRNIQSFLPQCSLAPGCLRRMTFEAILTIPGEGQDADQVVLARSTSFMTTRDTDSFNNTSPLQANTLEAQRYVLSFTVPDRRLDLNLSRGIVAVKVFAPTQNSPQTKMGEFIYPLLDLYVSNPSGEGRQSAVVDELSQSLVLDPIFTSTLSQKRNVEPEIGRSITTEPRPFYRNDLGAVVYTCGDRSTSSAFQTHLFAKQTDIRSVMLSENVENVLVDASEAKPVGLLSYSTIACGMFTAEGEESRYQ